MIRVGLILIWICFVLFDLVSCGVVSDFDGLGVLRYFPSSAYYTACFTYLFFFVFFATYIYIYNICVSHLADRDTGTSPYHSLLVNHFHGGVIVLKRKT